MKLNLLTTQELKNLREEHEDLVKQKHRWHWKPEKWTLINRFKLFVCAQLSETLERKLRDDYIDKGFQENVAYAVRYFAVEEIATKAGLDQQQLHQLRCFLDGKEFEPIPAILLGQPPETKK